MKKKRDGKKGNEKEIQLQIETVLTSLLWIRSQLNKASKTIQTRVKEKQVSEDGSIIFQGEVTSLELLQKKIHFLINKSGFEKKLLLDLYIKLETIKKSKNK